MYKNKNHQKSRARVGVGMTEFTAALAFLLPIILVSGFVAFQVAQVYMIKTTLDFAAQTAARKLAIAYGQNPTDAEAFPEKVFDQIRLVGIVASTDQFSIPSGTAGWNTAVNPPTVTVHVVFQGNKYGLAPFPSPDPLGLGEGFSLTSAATYRLE
jgi:Flp pilus assembly protein TadG